MLARVGTILFFSTETMPNPERGILCAGPSRWVFEDLASDLSSILWVDVVEKPRTYNYVLSLPESCEFGTIDSFIPADAVAIAADKRLVAQRFASGAVPTPETTICRSVEELKNFAIARSDKQWCLKYPTGIGATGHRLFTPDVSLPPDWPQPFVLQEFIELSRPEVYRTYCAGGSIFGWVVRRHPDETSTDPWVAHAKGARYERCGDIPAEAARAAKAAFIATSLLHSFGCADLLNSPTKGWIVLEVGTDGIFNHVDRDIGISQLKNEIDRRIAEAFWSDVSVPPWGMGAWFRLQ